MQKTQIPSGLVTFLFSDIEGSTKLAQKFPDILPISLSKHNFILKESIENNKGYVFKTVGDAFCAAFENADDAVNASLEAQVKINSEKWDEAVIKVRMGIHSGDAEWDGEDYSGYITLARVQRIMSAAHGGQVLISEDVFNKVSNNFSFRDLGERRLKDLRQTEHLYQFTSPDLPLDFPPLNTLDARPNNLPVQLTTFIGREDEMSDIKSLLFKTHLLTLIGAGGTGKTRIAIQTGADMIDDFTNGVWFVDLAPLMEPELLPQTLAEVLGVKEDPKREITETIRDYLKEKEMLIILDNCEQLIEACSKLSEKLLQSAPKLKIIATSREALRIPGEQTLRVSSLSLPDPKEDNTLEKLKKFESVRLFLDRALAVNQNFKIENSNVKALAEICHHLDGIPLAIELAAARVKVLSLEKISERLNDRFKLLTGGERTALPRQQTLRALIDWSYDLLSEQEKILWQRLSIFAGGWVMEAAEEVCGDINIDKYDILDLLNNLIEKSIIIFDEGKERYRMLETIKQYGYEKLGDANERDAMMNNHLKYFMERAEFIKPKLIGPDLKEWLNKLDEDYSNYQSALTWTLEGNKRQEGICLAVALCKYWHIRGYISEGRRWLSFVAQQRDDIPKPALASILNYLGVFDYAQGNYDRAQIELEEAFEVRRESGDNKSIVDGLNILGLLAYDKGEYDTARKLHEECLKLQREIGDKLGISTSINNLGLVYQNIQIKDNEENLEPLYKEGLKLFRELGDTRKTATFLNFLGNGFLDKSDFENARLHYEESLGLFRELGNIRGIAFLLGNLAILSKNQGDFSKAKTLLEESLSLSKSIGDKFGIAMNLTNLGETSIYQEEYDQAYTFLKKSLIILLELKNYLHISCNLLEFIQLAIHKHNNFKNAVILLGVIENAMKSIGAVFDMEIQIKYEQTILFLRENTKDEEFSAWLDEGKSMTPEKAAELAFSMNNE
ncbi:MAG: tetratricopeptide repeat protein [bacterium]